MKWRGESVAEEVGLVGQGETHIKDRELGKNSTELHVEKILSKLDLSHVD
jgi:hypothetical protein